MSREARDLLKELLEPNPKRRIPLQCVLAHPWFLRNLPPGYTRLNEALLVRRKQWVVLQRFRPPTPLVCARTQCHLALSSARRSVLAKRSPWRLWAGVPMPGL